jgi:nitrate/nitrite-specific signal transduction histidine kinase
MAKDPKKDSKLLKSAEEFLQIFRKGEEFTKSILKENERLRYRVAELEEALKQNTNTQRIKNYEERIAVLERELESLKERYIEVEQENRDFAHRFVEIEEENNNLANLYVASYQLHSTLEYEEVLKILIEIIINLIGAERFCIMLIDEKTGEIVPVASNDLSIDDLPKIEIGKGIIGKVAKEGESHFPQNISHTEDFDPYNPLVCIPLKIKDCTIGVIAIYSFLLQKKSFSNIDYELFNLLAGHAATAIFSSRLYTQSERKLSTIKGFIDLLTEKT